MGRMLRSKHWASRCLCCTSFAPDAKDLAGEAGLDQLLADASISAVLVVLPVDVAPKVTLRCLAAGKHVLQEKPAAPDVATALKARAAASRQEHRSRPFPPVWAIAENYRSERVFRAARTIISSGAVGDIIKLDLVADMPMNKANKYFSSQWRRNTTSCPGSFLMDSSVHFVAALRTLAHAAGFGEAVRVAGTAYSTTTALPPPDALAGYVGFGGGRGATVSISFACALPRFSLTATGTRGMLEVRACQPCVKHFGCDRVSCLHACKVLMGCHTSRLSICISYSTSIPVGSCVQHRS